MRRLFFALLLTAAAALAQQGQVTVRPDCFQFFTFTATGTSNVIDNRSAGCPYFAIDYSSSGFTVLSIVVQVAPDNNGVPGTWATYTAGSGSNPNTAITQASSTFSGFFPWVRVNLTSVTGSGTLSGILYGWRTPASVIASGGSGACPSPCPVDGPTAAGSPPTTPPVLTAGSDATNIRTILVDSSGRQQVVGAAASGAAKAGNPVQAGFVFNTTQPTVTTGQAVEAQASARGSLLVTPGVEGFAATGTKTNNNAAPGATNFGTLPGLANAAAPSYTEGNQVASSLDLAGNTRVIPMNYNGATWDQSFACTNQASFNLSGSGNTQIVALSSSKNIRVCHISFSTTATEDIKFTNGTGSNCASGTADVTGLYKSVQSMALDFRNTSPLIVPVSNALCINQSATQALGGIVIYALF